MGNRGLLHNEHQAVLRPFRLKAWLICLLEFKDRKRPVMAPRRYTELFFLDEATAFSAGHRPCSECRRKDFNRFKSCWLKGNPEYGFNEAIAIREIDAILHRERIDRQGSKVSYEEDVKILPEGSFVVCSDKPCLIAGKMLFPWTPGGYGGGIRSAGVGRVKVLTPRSVINAFREGYVPQMGV